MDVLTWRDLKKRQKDWITSEAFKTSLGSKLKADKLLRFLVNIPIDKFKSIQLVGRQCNLGGTKYSELSLIKHHMSDRIKSG